MDKFTGILLIILEVLIVLSVLALEIFVILKLNGWL